jgi:hypothetical protein
VHATTVLSDIVYAFPEARQCYSRVAEDLEGYGGEQNKEPTSGLEPLTCSLRVISHALQGFAEACKSPISRRFSLLWLAACCTVLRSRWCQSGVKLPLSKRRF